MQSPQSPDEFLRILGMHSQGEQDQIFRSALAGAPSNPADRVNQEVVAPFQEFLLKRGHSQIQKSSSDVETCSQGKHLALVSRRSFKDSKNREVISVVTSAYSVDGHFYPLVPAWLTKSGSPRDFGSQTSSFEQTDSCAAIVLRGDSREIAKCGVLASQHTLDMLRTQLKRASINVGLWQGAQGHAFTELLSVKSTFLAMVGWCIDRSNQQIPQRSLDYCAGFSTINSSTFPLVTGKAVIIPYNSEGKVTRRNDFYEISFEAKFDSILKLAGLDREKLELVEITGIYTFGHSLVDLSKVETWIGAVKPGSYIHTKAIYGGDGHSESTSAKLLDVKAKIQEELAANPLEDKFL